MTQLLGSLGLATAMVLATVVIHFLGLLLLIRLMERHGRRVDHWHRVARQSMLLVAAVLGIVLLHTVEIWLYAALYLALGVVNGLEPALYFSTVSFASLGFGDIVLGPQWRLVSAIETAHGVILFSWSTAFLISLMGKLRALEHDWLERRE
jgi:MFS family permease